MRLRKDCDVCDYVRDYNPRDFKNFSVIGSGGFASVHAAEWKNTRSKFAIKKFAKGSTEEEIINEVRFGVVCLCKLFDMVI